MNTFARIKPIVKYDKVSYYSVCMENNELSIFDEFIERHSTNNLEKDIIWKDDFTEIDCDDDFKLQF